ncbi:hypothetical protein [Mucilaginibacter myungsuensis]|uniref:Stationary phase survival protein SurE n=1 Tax=Mucilaginibacter myungsuensis TaxID=649104 RepID=A0A929PYI5_9SPHI|nr:hypothetical protein [Mucilaginibacter myungsuensis]MBE9664204.1 hypothetical protein [Mucilaginibacter myungsuensis]MDN3599906.1 hypothetical protein [Mucilaginibacter myungsuensis]
MLNKNTIATGILLGLILPALAAVLFEFIIQDGWKLIQRGMPYFITVALNLGLMRYFAGKGQDRTAQGVMLISFVFMVVVYFFRFR